MLSAKVGLQIGDFDNAVNRSYYAMFDLARAALLNSGVPENKMLRTHNGVIAAFRQHAIESGKIDVGLASALSRAEGMRVLADYTDTEIGAESAADAVAQAETFVQTVEQVFGLEESYQAGGPDNHEPDHDDKVSELSVSKEEPETGRVEVKPFSLEEERRQARENWLRFRQQQIHGVKGGDPGRVAGRGAGEDRSHSTGDDTEE